MMTAKQDLVSNTDPVLDPLNLNYTCLILLSPAVVDRYV